MMDVIGGLIVGAIIYLTLYPYWSLTNLSDLSYLSVISRSLLDVSKELKGIKDELRMIREGMKDEGERSQPGRHEKMG